MASSIRGSTTRGSTAAAPVRAVPESVGAASTQVAVIFAISNLRVVLGTAEADVARAPDVAAAMLLDGAEAALRELRAMIP